jgi:hypothetical protein
MALNIYIRFINLYFVSFISILTVIRWRPGAFFGFNIFISCFISFKVNSLRCPCD